MRINMSVKGILDLLQWWQTEPWSQRQARFMLRANTRHNEIKAKSWNKHLWINKICSLSRVSRAETKHLFVFWKIKTTVCDAVRGNIWAAQQPSELTFWAEYFGWSSERTVWCRRMFSKYSIFPLCSASELMWPARQWWAGAWKDDMRPVEMLPSADLSCSVWGSAADSYQSTWLHTLMFTDNVARIRAAVCRYNEYIMCECVCCVWLLFSGLRSVEKPQICTSNAATESCQQHPPAVMWPDSSECLWHWF